MSEASSLLVRNKFSLPAEEERLEHAIQNVGKISFNLLNGESNLISRFQVMTSHFLGHDLFCLCMVKIV